MRKKNLYCGPGFTVVEILTTVAIIAILIGLLIPALNMVKEAALNVKQKAQFNGIGFALEAFRAELVFGDYPPSNESIAPPNFYCGAQKLAEALVGQDGFGVHPDTEWQYNGVDIGSDPLYYKSDGSGISNLPQVEIDANIQSREGPFLDLEMANAVKLGDLYSGVLPTNNNFVLADMYGMVRHKRTQKRTGMPILYYRADTTKTMHEYGDSNNIYNSLDSYNSIVQHAPPFDSLLLHPLSDDTDQKIFYERTWNKNFTAPKRPYNADTFILHSAGLDGLYGTPDDVFNFDE